MTSLTVNGKPVTVEADPEKPLLWVLRDALNLKGTKYGCGVGICGVCTVLIDGEPPHACMVPLARAAGRAVTTIRGPRTGSPHGARLDRTVRTRHYLPPPPLENELPSSGKTGWHDPYCLTLEARARPRCCASASRARTACAAAVGAPVPGAIDTVTEMRHTNASTATAGLDVRE